MFRTLSLFALATFAASAMAAESVVDVVKTTQSWTGNTYVAYGSGQPEITMERIDVPAHWCLPWHVHTGIATTYVVSGAMDLQDQVTGKSLHLVAGDGFGESVNEVHRACTGYETAQLIRVHAGIKGQPTSINQ